MAFRQTSPLLRLPAELRNDIFSYALSDSRLDIDKQYHDGGTHLPGLVLACKQTLMETRVMYYTKASAMSKDRWIVGKWLARLNALPSSHPHRRIENICLDCRNRSEQTLPLKLGQRFALSHHSALALRNLRPRLEELRRRLEGSVVIMTCIVSPSQELLWTETPFALDETIERMWNELSEDEQRTLSIKDWMPSGTAGLFWSS